MAGLNYAFASDNTAGLCPEALAALIDANQGYVASYGEDAWTARAADSFRELFEADCDVYFVYNGTASNSLALASLCQSYHSVICHEQAHIETDECGAPEFFSNGTKILVTPGAHGKLQPAEIRRMVTRRKDINYPKPKVVSLSQTTELGTVYSVEEVAAIGATARELGLRVHMDGARFANAVVATGARPAELSWKAGVDVLSFGATKSGMSMADAVVFFDRRISEEFDYRCKQAGQLASKMRLLAAPCARLLQDGLWLGYARNANDKARRLAEALAALPGVSLLSPVQANAVFVRMPTALQQRLAARWKFYSFIGDGARFMCSWNTSDADIEALLADARAG